MKRLFVLLAAVLSPDLHSAISVDTSDMYRSITLNGSSLDDSDTYLIHGSYGGRGSNMTSVVTTNPGAVVTSYRRRTAVSRCPSDFPLVTDATGAGRPTVSAYKFTSWVRSLLLTDPLFNHTSGIGDPDASSISRVFLQVSCMVDDGVWTWQSIDVPDDAVIEPPWMAKSTCTLDGQSLVYDFRTMSTVTEGLTLVRDLYVNCSAGEARDYTLQLTGQKISDGRLSFENGVSSLISVNGTPLVANATGVSLNELTTRTLPIQATLVGNASEPGVANASGVLVLEAL